MHIDRELAEHLAASAYDTLFETGDNGWRIEQSARAEDEVELIELDEASGKPTGGKLIATVSVTIRNA